MTELSQKQRVSRRTVVKGAAWAAPVVAMASAAPAFAASYDPPNYSINGWVNVGWDPSRCSGWPQRPRTTTVSFSSDRTNTGGQYQYGLYVLDAEGKSITNSSVTYWIEATDTLAATSVWVKSSQGWSKDSGNPLSWTYDEKTYWGYRFNYSGPITKIGNRWYLNDIDASVTFGFRTDAPCPTRINQWIQRDVTVDGEHLMFSRERWYNLTNGNSQLDRFLSEGGPNGSGADPGARTLARSASTSDTAVQ